MRNGIAENLPAGLQGTPGYVESAALFNRADHREQLRRRDLSQGLTTQDREYVGLQSAENIVRMARASYALPVIPPKPRDGLERVAGANLGGDLLFTPCLQRVAAFFFQ